MTAPKGFVMVPVEPTEEMKLAWHRSTSGLFDDSYTDMLAAAPKPPAARPHELDDSIDIEIRRQREAASPAAPSPPTAAGGREEFLTRRLAERSTVLAQSAARIAALEDVLRRARTNIVNNGSYRLLTDSERSLVTRIDVALAPLPSPLPGRG